MHYTTLGRTGMRVSIAGLGCGGFSRLGLGTGGDEAGAIAIIRQAIELGVNLFDTAASYGTEAVLGKAIKSAPRDSVVICTKAPFSWSSGRADPEGVVAALDNSLRQLDAEYIDVYQLHGVSPANYAHALEALAPVLLRERDKGKFRFLGITETAPHDLPHDTLRRAAADRVWDMVMVGFSMMHQNARCATSSRNRVGSPRRCASSRPRARSPPRLPMATIRWASSFTPLARAASAMRVTAMSGTSRGSMSCCSAPAARCSSRPTSARC